MQTNSIVPFQVRLLPSTIDALKAYASTRGVRLADIHGEAIEHFLQHRADMKTHGREVPYLAGPSTVRTVNMQIPARFAELVQAAANEDGTTVTRFLYMALLSYATTRRLIRLFGTIESNPEFETPSYAENDDLPL